MTLLSAKNPAHGINRLVRNSDDGSAVQVFPVGEQPLVACFIGRLQSGKNELTGDIVADDAKLLPSFQNCHHPCYELPGKAGKWLAFQRLR